VHLDAERLRRDGLHLGPTTEFVAALATLGLNADVEVLDATDRASLLRQLAALAEARRTFDVVVAVGHSNSEGIRMASDDERVTPWGIFAGYVKPFVPRRLMLVACQAGCWPAADCLFTKLPKLRRIFASPVNASRDLAQFMLALVPYLVAVRAPRGRTVGWLQAAIAALTGGQVREWKRTRDKGNPTGILLDWAAKLADPYVRQLPGWLRSILS